MAKHLGHIRPPDDYELPSPEDRPPSGLESVGQVLLEMLDDESLTYEARCAIRAGISEHGVHPDCPCIYCHRALGTL
jgi:hypothetical protein